jgi:hypothetical protein
MQLHAAKLVGEDPHPKAVELLSLQQLGLDCITSILRLVSSCSSLQQKHRHGSWQQQGVGGCDLASIYIVTRVSTAWAPGQPGGLW